MKQVIILAVFFFLYNRFDEKLINANSIERHTTGYTYRQLRNGKLNAATIELSDNGGGRWYYDEADRISTDDNWSVIVDISGKRWKREWDGETVQVDWFGAIGDGVTDNTVAIQKAVDAAYKKKLQFTTGKVYRTNKIYLPLSITIDVNKAIIKPSLSPQYNGAIFSLEPLRNSLLTGLYAGGQTQVVKSPAIKRVPHVEVYNAIADLEMTTSSFCDASLWLSDNTVVDTFYIHDNSIQNFSRRAIGAAAPSFVTDSSGYFNTVIFEKNNIRYGGANQGLIVAADGKTGDTVLHIETLDHGNIISRLMVGRYVNIGTHLSGKALDVNGYESTNCIYRIKSFLIDKGDSSKAAIVIGGGGYSKRDGYLPDNLHEGLKTPVIKNAFLLPLESYQTPLLDILPDFSGNAGSNILRRATIDDKQSAAYKNVWPGLKFTINTMAYKGTYTITAVNADAISIEPALTEDVGKETLTPYGNAGACGYINGNIKNTYIRNNTFYGAGRGVSFSGMGKKGAFNEELDNRSYVEGNTYYYCWMSNETQSGNTVRSTLPYALLSNLSFTKGDTVIAVPDPSKYRTTLIDIDKDGAPDKTLVLATTTDDKIKPQNSLSVGDIISWYGLHQIYRITDISLQWDKSPTITVQRWNKKTKNIVAGGIDATVANSNTYFRVYSNALGQEGTIRYQRFANNKFYYTTRNSGGVGYHLSVRAYEMEIVNNYFEECEKGAFEVEAYSLLLKNNVFNFYTFDGTKPMPSLAKTNGAPGRGFNGWGTTAALNALIEDNTFNGYQPADGYNPNSGAFTIGQSAFAVSPQSSLIIKGNHINGVERMMTGTVTLSKIRGVSYPAFFYDYVEYTNNIITLGEDFMNDGFYKEFLGAKMVITGNTIQMGKASTKTLNLFRANQTPNPELFDSTGTYDIEIRDKLYGRPASLNTKFPSTKILFKSATVSPEK
jgi:hypothetical protein